MTNVQSTSFYDIFSSVLHRDSINFNVNSDEDSDSDEDSNVDFSHKNFNYDSETMQSSSNDSESTVKFVHFQDDEEEEDTVVNVVTSSNYAIQKCSDKKDNKQAEIEENIRVAMAKIQEATFRKVNFLNIFLKKFSFSFFSLIKGFIFYFFLLQLYLKVFAQDNSAKSLLADERMNIGAICGQLAAKNHISLDTSLCIIEHMPHLYLGKF